MAVYMNAAEFICASVVSFDDGETSGRVLQRGSRQERECVCDLLGAITVNDERRVVAARRRAGRAAMSDATSELPAECVRELRIAVLACAKMRGGAVMFLDEDDDFAPDAVRLARIGSHLVLCERPGDRQTSRPRRFTMYEVAETEPCVPFKLDPARALFVLAEQGFYTPPDWSLTCLIDPRIWYNGTMTATTGR